ncbi:alpha/beta fold hydrolase [Bacillus sp. p3-SID196]|uniref:alpha/beta fold hydrolase n=1 Tax=Bacillus sp. p3-SID196 TaxID=2940062 RepID=UPI00223BE8BE|nr:alpha/beta fold hydrolase [Bacillus sp. p3-SID196]MCT1378748.1 alpha/beta fold hydrolase [Bacillus sp. p3-SID196]
MKHIVFIPGIMGSELYEGEKKWGSKRWFTVRNKNAKRLIMNPNEDDDINPGLPLAHGYKMFGNVVAKNIVYAKIMNTLSSLNSKGFQFHPYGYDWRKNLWETCGDLDILLRKIGDEEIYIVAHSMGGLLIHTYCQWVKNAKKTMPNIKKVITLGTPWQGSPDSFKALKYGVKDKGYFFPDFDVTKKISRTFPSSYQLLPSVDYCLENKYLKQDGRTLRWSECIDVVQNLEGCNVQSIKMLNQTLHESLSKPWPSSIEHYNVIGVNQGSVGVLMLGANGLDGMQQPVDGDGVVPLNAALPYKTVNSTILYTQASHEGIVKHKPVLKWVKSLLENETADICDGIYEEYDPRTDWVMERIDCPVDVFIEGEEEEINKPSADITRHDIGEATYLIYNKPKATKIEVEAYADGRTTIETIKVVDGKVKSKTKFPSVDADPARKAIIDVEFQGEDPITKVYISNEDNPEEAIEVPGVNVVMPKTPQLNPPMTRVKINALGKKEGTHYDEHGISMAFTVKEAEESPLLETLYRINEGEWKRYTKLTNLTLRNGLIPGKNKIEYHSKDVYDNEEKVKRRVIYIEPNVPKTTYRIYLRPDTECILVLGKYYEGVGEYKFEYKIGEKGKVQEYKQPISFKPYEDKQIYVRTADIFQRKNEWEKVNISFKDLAETIWDVNGFEGTVLDIVSHLPQNEEEFIGCFIGKNEKDIYEKIPKTTRNLYLKFKDIEYVIELMPKLELYLHYHSQIIKREEKNVKISFSIYDAEDNPIKELEPAVKYTLIPTVDSNQDIVAPAVTSNGKGIYTFNVPVGHLSKSVQKIKLEFRDIPTRIKPLETHTFKVE